MKDRICRTPDCGNRAISRDVCSACYMAAYRLANGNRRLETGEEITFEVLEDSGVVSRPYEGSRTEFFLSKLKSKGD